MLKLKKCSPSHMFRPVRRIRKLWALSQKDPKALEKLENLTPEQMAIIPEEGDGKAVFFGEGTEAEFREQEKNDRGLKGIFGL